LLVSRAKLISKKLAGFSKSLGKLVEFTIEKKTQKKFPIFWVKNNKNLLELFPLANYNDWPRW
jgi:hypothetical protein